MAAVVNQRWWPLVGSVLQMGKGWDGVVRVAVFSWCSRSVATGCYAHLPGAKARTVALLFSVSHHCQSKFGSLSRRGLGGRTSNSTQAAVHIRARSRVGSIHPSLQNDRKRGVGEYQCQLGFGDIGDDTHRLAMHQLVLVYPGIFQWLLRWLGSFD